MAKRIIWICVIIACCVGGWYLWQNYKTRAQDTDGAVKCVANCDTPEQKARFALENNGDTPDGNREHKERTASQEAAAIASGFPAGTGPVSSNDAGQPMQPGQGYGNNQVVPVVVPPGQKPGNGSFALSNNSMSSNPMASMTNNAPDNQLGNRQAAFAPVGTPLMDSRSTNAPNDLRFAGGGAYQWYRQGNLTWRIDTATGRSCIIYATLEEWQKKIVASHGCGRGA